MPQQAQVRPCHSLLVQKPLAVEARNSYSRSCSWLCAASRLLRRQALVEGGLKVVSVCSPPKAVALNHIKEGLRLKAGQMPERLPLAHIQGCAPLVQQHLTPHGLNLTL